MTMKDIKSVDTLRKYCNTTYTNLTIKTINGKEIVYSYYTPIGLISNDKIMVVKDFNYSVTTSKHLYYLNKIPNVPITRKEFAQWLSNNHIPSGKL